MKTRSFLPVMSLAVEASAPLDPANDNRSHACNDALLHASLRHFGQHGLAAAQRARRQAQAAYGVGDKKEYAWWLEICRALDRRMAHELVQSTGESPGRR